MMVGSQNDSFINNINKQDNSKDRKMSPHSYDNEMSRETSKEKKVSSRERGLELKESKVIIQSNHLSSYLDVT
jgi:hypothetical protein